MDDFQAVELEMENCEKTIAISQALSRLENNGDFRKIFTEGLFTKEVLRLGLARGAADTDAMDRINHALDSISYLYHYLKGIHAKAELAKDTLAQGRRLIAESHEGI